VLLTQRLVTRTRHVYDRALRSVPITQHDKIWKQYIAFVKQVLLTPSLALTQSILAKRFDETRGVPASKSTNYYRDPDSQLEKNRSTGRGCWLLNHALLPAPRKDQLILLAKIIISTRYGTCAGLLSCR